MEYLCIIRYPLLNKITGWLHCRDTLRSWNLLIQLLLRSHVPYYLNPTALKRTTLTAINHASCR